MLAALLRGILAKCPRHRVCRPDIVSNCSKAFVVILKPMYRNVSFFLRLIFFAKSSRSPATAERWESIQRVRRFLKQQAASNISVSRISAYSSNAASVIDSTITLQPSLRDSRETFVDAKLWKLPPCMPMQLPSSKRFNFLSFESASVSSLPDTSKPDNRKSTRDGDAFSIAARTRHEHSRYSRERPGVK